VQPTGSAGISAGPRFFRARYQGGPCGPRAKERKVYDPVVGLSGVIAVETTCDGCVVSRLGGAYFGVFFLGFFASRLRLSLFPMPPSMPRVANLLPGNVQFWGG
jgi:hypothetical protein